MMNTTNMSMISNLDTTAITTMTATTATTTSSSIENGNVLSSNNTTSTTIHGKILYYAIHFISFISNTFVKAIHQTFECL